MYDGFLDLENFMVEVEAKVAPKQRQHVLDVAL
jgi:hypothetical protein